MIKDFKKQLDTQDPVSHSTPKSHYSTFILEEMSHFIFLI